MAASALGAPRTHGDMRTRRRARAEALALLVALIPAGFAMKLYGSRFVADSLAGAAYELFWCLLAFVLFPSRRAAARIAALVLLATGALEFVQLVDHPALEAIRRTFIGRTIIGNAFAWSDFPYYVLGCAIGWAIMHSIAPKGGSASS